MFKVPKKYFHDRSILLLTSVNLALFILALISVLFGVDSGENPTSIVAYRDTTKIGQISGPTDALYQFALFVTITTLGSFFLSTKLFTLRRHLAVGMLGLNILLLSLTIIIFNALTKTL
jgi:hypothetical protein